MRLADKYDIIPHAESSITIELKSQLTVANMCWGYQFAMYFKFTELIDSCEREIARSPKEIFYIQGISSLR